MPVIAVDALLVLSVGSLDVLDAEQIVALLDIAVVYLRHRAHIGSIHCIAGHKLRTRMDFIENPS